MSRLLFPPERVQAVNEANAALREAVRRGKYRSPEHLAAVQRFHEALRAVWPPELWTAMEPPFNDPAHLDLVLRFLEEDPVFFRSGYVKEAALGRLSRFALDDEARKRIAGIVLAAVDGPGRREFRRVCTAARHVDRRLLAPGLLRRLESADPSLVWRAYCAARGMLGMPFPSGHLLPPIRALRAPSDVQATLDKINLRRLERAERKKVENQRGIVCMRERLRLMLEAR